MFEDLKFEVSGGEKVNIGMGVVLMKGILYKVNKNCFMLVLGILC